MNEGKWTIDNQDTFINENGIPETVTRVGCQDGETNEHVGYLSQFEREDELRIVKCVNAYPLLIQAIRELQTAAERLRTEIILQRSEINTNALTGYWRANATAQEVLAEIGELDNEPAESEV